MTTYRIAMTFNRYCSLWQVTDCYEGKGPVPMVRPATTGGKELVLSSRMAQEVGDTICPFALLRHWQKRPVRQQRIVESREARRAKA